MGRKIVLDSNVVLKLLLDEEDSLEARAVYKALVLNGYEFLAPRYLKTETCSTLVRKSIIGLVPEDEVEILINKLNEFDITYIEDAKLLDSAVKIALKARCPGIYDSMYFAISFANKCDFVTGDIKFMDKIKKFYSDIYTIQEYQKLLVNL